MTAEVASVSGITLNDIKFAYPGCPPFIQGCDLDLPRGSRCLLVGANGMGKTTLLQILAGKYMVPRESVLVLGRSPFYDLQLTCAGQLSYLGTSWRKDVAFAGYGVPLQGDMSAGKMLFGVEGVDPERRARLIRLLDIDLYQRMNTMSDGQRRRVQICMGLLKPYDVLLLDEITVDLDVVGRLQLLDFFKQECEERNATILYATHIFDGLEDWTTHIAYMEGGRFARVGPKETVVPQLARGILTTTTESEALAGTGGGEGQEVGRKLLHEVEGWLRTEREARRIADAGKPAASLEAELRPTRTPFMPSKHLAFFR